jgi:hypothetical protein
LSGMRIRTRKGDHPLPRTQTPRGRGRARGRVLGRHGLCAPITTTDAAEVAQ